MSGGSFPVGVRVSEIVDYSTESNRGLTSSLCIRSVNLLLMSSSLHFVVRTVHVFGMIALVSGSAYIWIVLRTGEMVPPGRLRTFEFGFWTVMGIMVATGVGNIAALGAPGPKTRWGTVLTVKLLVVFVFVIGSFVRTLLVFQVRDKKITDTQTSTLKRTYATTTVTLLLVVVLAEVLAHG